MAPEVKLNSIRMQRAHRCNNIETLRLQEFLKVLEKNSKYEKRVKEEEARLVEYTMDKIKECSGLSPQSNYLRKRDEDKEERAKRAKSAPVLRSRGRSAKPDPDSKENQPKRRPYSTVLKKSGKGVGKVDEDSGDIINKKRNNLAGIGNSFGVKKGWDDDGSSGDDDDDYDDDDTDEDEDDDVFGSSQNSRGTENSLTLISGSFSKPGRAAFGSSSHHRGITNEKLGHSTRPRTSQSSPDTPNLSTEIAQQRIRAQTASGGRPKPFMTASQAHLMMQVSSIRRLEKCQKMINVEKAYQKDVLTKRLADFNELYPVTGNAKT